MARKSIADSVHNQYDGDSEDMQLLVWSPLSFVLGA